MFGPGEKRPLNIPLTELSPDEAAKFVANEFLSVSYYSKAIPIKEINNLAFVVLASSKCTGSKMQVESTCIPGDYDYTTT